MKKTLSIEGMTCGGCVRHTTEALEGVDGVTSVAVDLASKSAVVESDADMSDDVLKEAVKEAGYTVTSVS
ncbi:MAG: heavy metal-associated domain-containing protein [Nitrospinota bacterium]